MQETETQLPTVFPTISADVTVGAFFDTVDVDIHRLTDHLLENEMTPEQIEQLTIHFKDGSGEKTYTTWDRLMLLIKMREQSEFAL